MKSHHLVGIGILGNSPERYFRIYFYQNEATPGIWGERGDNDVIRDNLKSMIDRFDKSQYTSKGVGVILCFSDAETGTSRIFPFNPEHKHAVLKGIDLKNADLDNRLENDKNVACNTELSVMLLESRRYEHTDIEEYATHPDSITDPKNSVFELDNEFKDDSGHVLYLADWSLQPQK